MVELRGTDSILRWQQAAGRGWYDKYPLHDGAQPNAGHRTPRKNAGKQRPPIVLGGTAPDQLQHTVYYFNIANIQA